MGASRWRTTTNSSAVRVAYVVAEVTLGLSLGLMGLVVGAEGRVGAHIQDTPASPDGLQVEEVAAGLAMPVALAFAPDGRLFFAEKGGWNGTAIAAVHIIENGVLRPTPFVTVTVDSEWEHGLLGVAFDPDFALNHYVYVYYIAPGAPPREQWVRYTEDPVSQTGHNPSVLLDIPRRTGRPVHVGGNLRFGPDRRLYLAIGDNDWSIGAQDLNLYAGKVHRFNADGSIPPDNPFTNSPTVTVKSIYAYGLRNTFGFDFDPVTGALFGLDNGETCDDELNRLLPGANYGWGVYGWSLCPYPDGGGRPPLHEWTPTIGPAGAAFYQGANLPNWQYNLFFCAWNDGVMRRVVFDLSRQRVQAVLTLDVGGRCRLDVENGPDGWLYFSDQTGIYRLLGGNDLSSSRMAVEPVLAYTGDTLTYTLWLYNAGTLGTDFYLTDVLPPQVRYIPGSARASRGVLTDTEDIMWTGMLLPDEVATATFGVTVTTGAAVAILNVARLSDGATLRELQAVVLANPRNTYLSTVMTGELQP